MASSEDQSLGPARSESIGEHWRYSSFESSAHSRSAFGAAIDTHDRNPILGSRIEPSTLFIPLRPKGFTNPPTPTSSRSSFFTSKSNDPMIEQLIPHKSPRIAQRELHWRTPFLLVVSFFIGTSAALGQHFLYRFLHHKTEDDDDKKTRLVLYGRVIAYIAKAAFGKCIIMCYHQRIWRTFREHALSIRAIDQLFLAAEDPSLFINWETISKAPLLTIMALILWLIPLATIISSPSALSFGWHLEHSSSIVLVPTVNFSVESTKDWRYPTKTPDGKSKYSLLFYNTTDVRAQSEGWFDYYDLPSEALKNLTERNVYSAPHNVLNNALSGDASRKKACGGNFNCTYSVSFIGPGYNCKEVMNSTWHDPLAGAEAPFNTSVLAPEGLYAYYASVDIGEYERPQSKNLSPTGGIPLGDIPEHFGSFKAEPAIWIGYVVNSTERLPENSPFIANWSHRLDPHIFRCMHYETRYTLRWNFTGSLFKMESSYSPIAPIINTNISYSDNSTGPPENFISPRTDVLRYKKTAAYHAIGQGFRDFLRGDMRLKPPIPGPPQATVSSDVHKLLLGTEKYGIFSPGLHERLLALYADIVISLIAQPQLLVSSDEETLVNRTRFQPAFIYDPEKLWICYAPVIFLTIIILLINAWLIREDGTTFSVGFSRILATTRNPTLDDISQGVCLGNDPFPEEFMRRKIKFGALQKEIRLDDKSINSDQGEGVGHCAFGLPTEVSLIRRDTLYAGIGRVSGYKAKKEKVD